MYHYLLVIIYILTLILVSIILYKVYNMNKSNYYYSIPVPYSKLSNTKLFKYQERKGKGNNINLFHWNTHYECFNNKCNIIAESCPQAVIGFINQNLVERSIDFANFIDLEQNIKLPNGYNILNLYENSIKCGYDYNCLVYNSNLWIPLTNTPYIRCMESPPNYPNLNRIAIIQQFKNKNTNLLVWVIGAHFGHPDPPTHTMTIVLQNLNNIIKDIIKPTDNIILLADTNASFHSGEESNDYIMNTILPGITKVNGTTPYKSCCYSDMNPTKSEFTPFMWESDRIISNFGSKMITDSNWVSSDTNYFLNQINISSSCSSLNDINKQPSIGEMHKPVFATLLIHNG
jgi:NAD-dependent dihydropyrimidine dehydrogenase PreA subunit